MSLARDDGGDGGDRLGAGGEPWSATKRAAGGAAAREGLDLPAMARWLKPLSSPLRLELLRYLREPHYLEEVASHLKLTRQAARRHLDLLASIGVLERRSGVRASGPVTEYVTNQQALFRIYDRFEMLGSLAPVDPGPLLAMTIPASGGRSPRGSESGPWLCVVRGLGTGAIHRLAWDKDAWLLGRDARCEVGVPWDPFVSNRHAEVRRTRDGFALHDLRSTNGTQLNWARMPPGAGAALRHGDLLGVGRTLLLFRDEGTRK